MYTPEQIAQLVQTFSQVGYRTDIACKELNKKKD